MELRLQYPPTPEHAKDLAGVCADVAKKVSNLDLDYSPASLEAVDQQLGKFHAENLSSEQIASTLFSFGCYVGEVLIRNLGGRWVWLEDSPLAKYGGPPIVVMLDSGACWNPIGKVFNRVDEGIEDNIPYFFQVASASGRQKAGSTE